MNAVVKTDTAHAMMEQVLVKGDLAVLTPEQRNSYYQAVCTSVGLNPLTKPFEYIVLNGKMRLYALKDCTDQLRSIHGISVTELIESEREGVFIVKAKVCNKDGRTDVSTGAVTITGLKGEALANALMKSETKAKRRATLSICGLGMLDETEVDDIPASQKAPVERSRVPSPSDAQQPEPSTQARSSAHQEAPKHVAPYTLETHETHAGGKPRKFPEFAEEYKRCISTAKNLGELRQWDKLNDPALMVIHNTQKPLYDEIDAAVSARMKEIGTPAAKSDKLKEDPISTSKPKTKKAPDFAKDYDGWMTHKLEAISKATTVDDLEEIFAVIDGVWPDLLPPDKDTFQAARRDAEARLEP